MRTRGSPYRLPFGDLDRPVRVADDHVGGGAVTAGCAHLPLRNMFGYSTRLRSLTEGRATFSMTFHAYDTLCS
jgi:elongation factor G